MVKPINILLVEDNPGDVRLTIEALNEAKRHSRFQVARDGIEALDILYRRGEYDGTGPTDLVLLDLNLPRKDGREVLAEIKADPALRRMPVVILTNSESEEDIVRTYDLHANCYLTKPVDLEQFLKVIAAVENFWLTVVKLPPM